jgi:hypothetical protein
MGTKPSVSLDVMPTWPIFQEKRIPRYNLAPTKVPEQIMHGHKYRAYISRVNVKSTKTRAPTEEHI